MSNNVQSRMSASPQFAALVSVAILYIPAFLLAIKFWLTNDNYSYCLFIVPICIYLAWESRGRLAQTPIQPDPLGLLLVIPGLLLEFAGYQLGIAQLAMWSLVPTVAGVVLALYGRKFLRLLAFPICYLFFAGSLPSMVFGTVNGEIQSVSTSISAVIMQLLGFTVSQTGNQISVPGLDIEVADVCSGYRKTIVLIAFVMLYTHMLNKSWPVRWLMVLLTIPLAVLANCVRICALITVASSAGLHVFELVHAPADFAVLIFAFYMIVILARNLNWPILKSQPSY